MATRTGRAVARMTEGRPEAKPLRGLGFPKGPGSLPQRHRRVPAVRASYKAKDRLR
ncbi:hypothetical protein OR263_35455 [Streptomyces sp. NEAU-H22]|uniref:hypothetical protein n=1 Tax=unclassified Streptomyces TaxID=2593676 RepID=UPI002252ABB1|nr:MULTISPECIES: hypothetical protein [unclassified Streptomyces]MCX3291934.1 hypothetical protein [Streptomyces sp. NEAU-H22]WMD06858.1 hypothetical protein Q7C01_21820 [Streptomyces sp. FXY-T5]